MYINSTSKADKVPVYTENAEEVFMQIIIGEMHGSGNITIRILFNFCTTKEIIFCGAFSK